MASLHTKPPLLAALHKYEGSNLSVLLPDVIHWEEIRKRLVGPGGTEHLSRSYARTLARVPQETIEGNGAIRTYLVLDHAWHTGPYLRRVMTHVPSWTPCAVQCLEIPYVYYASARLLLSAAREASPSLRLANAFHRLFEAWSEIVNGLERAEGSWPYSNLDTVEGMESAIQRLQERHSSTQDLALSPTRHPKGLFYEEFPIPKPLTIASEDCRTLLNVAQVVETARRLGICLGESVYTSQMRRGRMVAIAYGPQDGLRGVLVLARDQEDGWIVHGLTGPENSPPAEDLLRHAQRFCAKNGITMKHENS